MCLSICLKSTFLNGARDLNQTEKNYCMLSSSHEKARTASRGKKEQTYREVLISWYAGSDLWKRVPDSGKNRLHGGTLTRKPSTDWKHIWSTGGKLFVRRKNDLEEKKKIASAEGLAKVAS